MQIEVLGERYQLQDPIGRGGMATIYRGRDMRMDRTVAIKVLREVYSTDPKFVTRFQREAKAASALQHPNIVQVYDYGQSDGNYFIVMELVEGTDLRRYLRSRGILARDRAIIIAHDIALGLGAAHRRGIVHRDVKPQNVLVGRDGSIKLTDFGIASVYKDINAERLTTTGMTLGTVQYYAPEQAQGEIVSPAADVYALGIVMYEMLTGRTPFDGDTPVAVAMQHIQDIPTPPSHLNPNIPPALEEIILRCLEKVPEMRFRDGSTLARALEAPELLGADGAGNGPINNTHVSGIHTPPLNEPLNTIPQRPNGTNRPPVSSPNLRANNYVPTSNGVQDSSGENTIRVDQSYAPMPVGAGTMAEVNQGPSPYMAPPLDVGAGATRPFRRGTITHSGQEQRESRFASVVTLLILLATLLLLGFSIYLAGELGFIPSWPKASTPVTPTIAQQVTVPDLRGMDIQAARDKAKSLGFTIQIHNDLTTGTIKAQYPAPPDTAPYGSSILVDLQPPAPTVKVPDGLAGDTLAHAKTVLDGAHIAYTIARDPNDPIDYRQGANMVTRTDPASGTVLKDGQTVIIYVVNLTNGTPTPVPTQPPAPTPTQQPTPTPTPTQQPTVTPTQQPTKTPRPKMSPTASPVGSTPVG